MKRPFVKRLTLDRFKKKKYDVDANLLRAAKRSALGYAGNKCQECASIDNLQVHHIIPVSKGGHPLALSNLKVLCEICHRKKHNHMRR